MMNEYLTYKSKKTRGWWLLILLSIAVPILFVTNTVFGIINIPISECIKVLTMNDSVSDVYRNILLNTRLPQAFTAVLAGVGLSVAGLQMQSLFRNPLADPSIIGISSGSTLGVAIYMMFVSSYTATLWARSYILSSLMTAFAAFIGAVVVLVVIMYFSKQIKQTNTLLIIGIMISFACSSFVGILQYTGLREKVHSYVIWGLGSFSNVTWIDIYVMTPLVIIAIAGALMMSKQQNMLLLGEGYAYNLGLNIRKTRMLLILCSGLLTAVITAFCGPIAFIGLAVPHIARVVFKTSDHKILIPASMVIGAIVTLSCNILINLPFANGLIPINSITSLIGAPVVIWFLLKGRVR